MQTQIEVPWELQNLLQTVNAPQDTFLWSDFSRVPRDLHILFKVFRLLSIVLSVLFPYALFQTVYNPSLGWCAFFGICSGFVLHGLLHLIAIECGSRLYPYRPKTTGNGKFSGNFNPVKIG
jgi:hypothetical protein